MTAEPATSTGAGGTACRICRSPAAAFARATLLGRHAVQYYRCAGCGFVQTEEPYWLAEAYSTAITKSDVGLVGRSVSFSRIVRNLVYLFLDRNGRFLDFGAGYGLFVRMMRDFGLDFRWFDDSCENLFAEGFEGGVDAGEHYDLVTAIEVFEHLVDPMPYVARMVRAADGVFFTTVLLPDPPSPPGSWWYYGLEHGQHVSLFSASSLVHIAREFGLHLQSDGVFIHLMTRRRLPARALRIAKSQAIGIILNPILERIAARRSLLNRDFEAITGQMLS